MPARACPGQCRGRLSPAPHTEQPLCQASAGRAWPRRAQHPWAGGSALPWRLQQKGWGDGPMPRHSEWPGGAQRCAGRQDAGAPCALPAPHTHPGSLPCSTALAPAYEGQLIKELWGLARLGEPGTPPGVTAPALRPTRAVVGGGGSPCSPHAARAGLGSPIPDQAPCQRCSGGGCRDCGDQAHGQHRQGVPLAPQIQ